MTTKQGRILVIRGGAIGDFILTLPAITARASSRALISKSRLPAHRATSAPGRTGGSGASHRSAGLAGFLARAGVLAEDLGDYFAAFDVIISYLYDPDGIFQTNVARCSRAQFIAGRHRPDESEPLHATQTFLKALERLSIFDADPVPRLGLGPCADVSTTLALHPGSGSERKNWPEERWAELLLWLIEATRMP